MMVVRGWWVVVEVVLMMEMCSDYILYLPIRAKSSFFEVRSTRSWLTSMHVFPASFLQQRYVFDWSVKVHV